MLPFGAVGGGRQRCERADSIGVHGETQQPPRTNLDHTLVGKHALCGGAPLVQLCRRGQSSLEGKF